jgi:hypothetical protein
VGPVTRGITAATRAQLIANYDPYTASITESQPWSVMLPVPGVTTNTNPQAGLPTPAPGQLPLQLGSNGPFGNGPATSSAPGWACATAGNDLWFTYQAPPATNVTFTTCSPGTDIDTVMQMFQGSCGVLANLGCNDDWCGLGSQVTIQATQGTTYFVRVGGFNGATGEFDVDISFGTGTGSITRNAHACGPTTIQCIGEPHIGATVSTVLGNVTGAPFLGFGFVPGSTPFCGCVLGHEWLTAMYGSGHNLHVPLNASVIGLSIAIQGADFMGTGGCPAPQVGFTDTMVIVIG